MALDGRVRGNRWGFEFEFGFRDVSPAASFTVLSSWAKRRIDALAGSIGGAKEYIGPSARKRRAPQDDSLGGCTIASLLSFELRLTFFQKRFRSFGLVFCGAADAE